jgi:hypothetical protein
MCISSTEAGDQKAIALDLLSSFEVLEQDQVYLLDRYASIINNCS